MTNVTNLRDRQSPGAIPAEWKAWVDAIGTDDLLPVVSDPAGQISPDSQLKALGKTPSRFGRDGMVFGFGRWTQFIATDSDIALWSNDQRLGISVQTRWVRGCDADVTDAAEAEAIKAVILRHAPGSPIRFRAGTSKFLIPIKVDGEFPKKTIPVNSGVVEFLATGQQFIAHGSHFDSKGPTGTRYDWVGGPADMVTLTHEAWELMIFELEQTFAVSDSLGGTLGRGRKGDDFAADDEVGQYLLEHWETFGATTRGYLAIRCPWEADHSDGQGDPSSTTWMPPGTGGFEQGQFQCLHAHCQGKRSRTDFLEAVGYAQSQFENLDELEDQAIVEAGGDPAVEREAVMPRNLVRNKDGDVLPILHNLQLCLEVPGLYGVRELRYDEFMDDLIVDGRPFEDADGVAIRLALERRGFKPIGKELLRDALVDHAKRHRFDSAKEWLATLPAWDGVSRCETFWIRLFGVEDTPYSRAVGLYTWSALAGRIIEPGVQADMAIVLRGKQGLGKSQGVKAMAPWPETFTKVSFGHKDDDLARKLRGRVVVELDELNGLRSRDAESIKSWITQQVEEWVQKYQERISRFKRRCILMGTTNQDGFLDDDTGERRWLPMTVGLISRGGIGREQHQLWAEAALLFDLGGVLWQDAERLAVNEHEKYAARDVWEETIGNWLEAYSLGDEEGETPFARGWTTTMEVAEGCLGLTARTCGAGEQRRIAKVMKRLGWEQKQPRIDGRKQRRWEREA